MSATHIHTAASAYVELTEAGDEVVFHRPPGLPDDTWWWIAENMNATWHAWTSTLDVNSPGASA